MKSTIQFSLIILVGSFVVNADLEINQSSTNFLELRNYNSSHKLNTDYIPPEHIINKYPNGSLLEIICQKCGIKKLLDSNFIGAPKLINLTLNFNEIKIVESNMFKGLENLELLDIADNQIEVLNSDLLQYLPILKTFDVSNNKIHHIDANTFNYSKMFNIEISLNPIVELNLIFQHIESMSCGCCKLKKVILDGTIYEIYLSHNEINELSLSENSNLTSINLSSNNLSAPLSVIKSIDGKMLKNLYLVGTKLDYEILGDDIFKSMPQLNLLALGTTNLSYVKKELLEPLKDLEKLWIEQNNISEISAEVLDQLPNLKDISWEDNPWKCSSLLPILRKYTLPKLSQEEIQNLVSNSTICADN